MESEELNLTDDELFLRFMQFRQRKLKEAKGKKKGAAVKPLDLLLTFIDTL